MMFVIAYIASIVVVNWAFSVVPMLPLPGGEMFPPVALLVGGVFVLRDLAQRAVGHRVLGAMAAGAALSFLLADPYVAAASATAFVVSEILDWATYTLTRRPLADRILISSIVSTPADTAVFLLMIGAFGWAGFTAMVLSKMLGAAVVWTAMQRPV